MCKKGDVVMSEFYKFSDIMRVVYGRYNLPGDLGTGKMKQMDERVRRVVRSRLNRVEYRNARTEDGYPEDVIIKLLDGDLRDELLELSKEANELAGPEIRWADEVLKKEGVLVKYSENSSRFGRMLLNRVSSVQPGGAFFFGYLMDALEKKDRVNILIEEPVSGPGVTEKVSDAELMGDCLQIFFENGENAVLHLSAQEITMVTEQKFYVNCKGAGQVATVQFIGG